MGIEFGPKKSESNFKKYGVYFSDVEPVLEDPRALTIEDATSEEEQRFITVGLDALGRIITVVWTDTDQEETYRIISPRKASYGEAKSYYED